MDVAAEFRMRGVSVGEEDDESDGQGKGSLVWAHSGYSVLTRLHLRPLWWPSVSGSGGDLMLEKGGGIRIVKAFLYWIAATTGAPQVASWDRGLLQTVTASVGRI